MSDVRNGVKRKQLPPHMFGIGTCESPGQWSILLEEDGNALGICSQNNWHHGNLRRAGVCEWPG